MAKYTKALIAVAGAGVAALSLALDDGIIIGSEWTTVAIAVITAVGVYFFPNEKS